MFLFHWGWEVGKFAHRFSCSHHFAHSLFFSSKRPLSLSSTILFHFELGALSSTNIWEMREWEEELDTFLRSQLTSFSHCRQNRGAKIKWRAAVYFNLCVCALLLCSIILFIKAFARLVVRTPSSPMYDDSYMCCLLIWLLFTMPHSPLLKYIFSANKQRLCVLWILRTHTNTVELRKDEKARETERRRVNSKCITNIIYLWHTHTYMR